MKEKFKICTYLEDSLYVAPNEIRSCCKRFFYEGKMRGDAKLLKINNGITPKTLDIQKARKKIFDEIQENLNEDCKGCIYLKNSNKKPRFTSKIKFLSIEHHSVCNLRCDYCSEIYWGGKRSKYDVVKFISQLSQEGALNNCHQVVWGGGEPTLDKSFEKIFEEIHKIANPNIYHRVFTNSVRFSEPLAKFLKLGMVKITTSVDSGTEETFKKIRGREKFFDVFTNLQKYSEIDSTKITVKYIFTGDNFEEKEIDSFVSNCKKFELHNCNYQISVNYKNEKLEFRILKSIAYLFFRLYENNIRKIFLDDHIMFSFISLNEEDLNNLKEYLSIYNASKILLDPLNIKDLFVYGSGEIATQIITKTNFFKMVKNFDLIDSNPEIIGKQILNRNILPPTDINKVDKPIFIASAQHYDEIYKKIIQIKGDAKSIISGLIV